MDTSHSDTNQPSAAVKLGSLIRQARKNKGWSIADLAEKIGRPREWLNRIELGYSEYGEHKPASPSDLRAIISFLGNAFEASTEELMELGTEAEKNFMALKQATRGRSKNLAGKLTQAEVIIGEEEISQAIVDLIREQHSDAIIRNIGIKVEGSYLQSTPGWRKYREALGEFLAKHPNGLFKRLEFVATNHQLELAKQADERLAGGRNFKDIHNAKVKFTKQNPLQLHVLIGQREAVLALPHTAGLGGSNMALLVRDKLFVEALREWYDEVLWESHGPNQAVDFARFDESFDDIKQMYRYKD